MQAVLFVELELGFEVELGLFDSFRKFLELLFIRKICFLFEVAFGEQLDELCVAQAASEFRGDLIVFLNIQKKLGEVAPFKRLAALGFDDVLFGGAFHQLAGEFALIANVAVHFAALDAIEWRLRDVDVLFFDQLAHMAEEKSEQKSADVATVYIRIGHQNDFVVAEFRSVKIVLADASAESGDNGANFFVAEHFVVAGLFDVEDFALQRKDGLIAAVATTFSGTAGGFALDQKEFTARGIAFLAVGELSGQAAGIERGFAARKFAGFAGRFTRTSGVNALADNFSRDRGVLIEIFTELFIDEGFDQTLDVAIEFALGLALELGLWQLH